MAKKVGTVTVNDDRCKGCGLCVAACPTHSLALSEKFNRHGYHPAEFLEDSGCTACGSCFYACPEPAAITIYELSETAA